MPLVPCIMPFGPPVISATAAQTDGSAPTWLLSTFLVSNFKWPLSVYRPHAVPAQPSIVGEVNVPGSNPQPTGESP